ncbi:exodeoxyribonuclease V subunit gamma [Beggiatoa leptomitoformis]|uniref:RecBCD enzyme subunit RecC n=1 Tax=Beggiatoa leptomitoformis TaxID=288004 RepID=A0A2N9YBD0_9GAMM|nr:exodeoxyribonuclease V subunit gamma [Beggiatoa leptomitoformis]ALG66865.1 exodeoxyribonuclease V subunit gamma [Beggiatoa leptomitoformis]AUI67780.1 exodeoxyribonuclease V subunit gamma [Beggiatoa leptomitoformis]
MLHIYTSNQLECLRDELVHLLQTPLENPLEKETIIVQSKGMERWLSMQLAEQTGVWANADFPFPDKMLWRIFRRAIRELPDVSKFERGVMTWTLLTILPDLLTKPEFSELNHYLQGEIHSLKAYQLANRIADTFDQYVVFRPLMIADWENGKLSPHWTKNDPTEPWQAILWRALIAKHGKQHRAAVRASFFQQLNSQLSTRLPKRLAIFGIAALPPFFLDVLVQLGAFLEVHIFLLNPCREYWGHIVSDTEIARKTVLFRGKVVAPESLYLEKGNSLLASWGRLGREFIDSLNDYYYENYDKFIDPVENNPCPTLLAYLQSDILNLVDRGEIQQITHQKITLEKLDSSLQIHACHSLMREVEILHDRLLALFEADNTLQARDILVMMPDIEAYTPYIQAVFATAPTERYIPYSLADRQLRGESALVDSFLAILELQHSRFSSSDVLRLLETPTIQARFSLEENDVERIRNWIEKTGIRWGIDGYNRASLELPDLAENTWRAGLDRLLLGYALPKLPMATLDAQECLFAGILPYDEVEGSDALILGKLLDFSEKLFTAIDGLKQARLADDWVVFLNNVLDTFLQTNDDNEAEAQAIRNSLEKLRDSTQLAEFNQVISFEVVFAFLHNLLNVEPQATHFLTGQVTFCAMLPMRSIPFKVVCLLGMNDKDFPRLDKPLSFDLLVKNPQRGDRSRRGNDRYLFLEALLSARSCFYVSYIGKSAYDNTEMPPSVLVSELLDYLDKAFIPPVIEPVLSQQLVIHHPLQGFSPRYFSTENPFLFSYAQAYCDASHVLQQAHQEPMAFIKQWLPSPPDELLDISLRDFVEFFIHPTKFLLRKRLGIYLETGIGGLAEVEPFQLTGLEGYSFNQSLIERTLAGQALEDYFPIAKAGGQLPHGEIGDCVYQQLTDEINNFAHKVKGFTEKNQRIAPVFIDLKVGRLRITGNIDHLWSQHLIHYRYATLKAKDHLRIWIAHLCLNTLADKKTPKSSHLLGKTDIYHYAPLSNAFILLEELAELYYQGLQNPLHFFPESAFSFVEKGRKVEPFNESEGFKAAHGKWKGSDYSKDNQPQGEKEDDYYQLCFRGKQHNPLDSAFADVAKRIYLPLMQIMTKA